MPIITQAEAVEACFVDGEAAKELLSRTAGIHVAMQVWFMHPLAFWLVANC
jgi:hypothetical protein